MEQFSIDKALELGAARVQTRCGFKVTAVGETLVDDLPVFAVVMEVVEETDGRRRKKRLRKKLTKTHIEPNMVLYHADGRLHEDKDDDFDLVITEEP